MAPIEIMAPVGSWDSLTAAIQARADSVYFGIGHLNMRSHAAFNFTIPDLRKIVQIGRKNKIKTYVALNSILYDEDLSLMREYCQAIKASGATAVIASDMAAIQFATSIGLPIHCSTQLNISNLEAVRFFAQFSDVLVLARELRLDQIQLIGEQIKKEEIRGPSGQLVQIELFVHGALCVSISGKCYMSLSLYNKSANRGECIQPCRRKYRVFDDETQNELVIDNQYVMSPKDLCTIGRLDEIVDAGVSILKIEGRGRAPEYVYTVVGAYREAADAIERGAFSNEKIQIWMDRLKSVYNRGFWEGGYYLGEKAGEWSKKPGSQATQRKKYLGKVTKYFPRIQVAECQLQSGSIRKGDPILITGSTTGVIEARIESLHENGSVEFADQGALVSFPVPSRVRKNDLLYLIEPGQCHEGN
ncbi:MAG: family peptidase [Parachlamydiales bacterium]|nr:family peptidase [Parachlamydiales bacterium]